MGFGQHGGGISVNQGDLTLDHAVISENSASDTETIGCAFAEAGAIYSSTDGTLKLLDSTVSSNSATATSTGTCPVPPFPVPLSVANVGGGAVTYAGNGKLHIERSTISGNKATATATIGSATGGGVSTSLEGLGSGATTTIKNSTLSGNQAVGSGGGSGLGGAIATTAGTSVTLLQSDTITANTAASGANVYNGQSAITIKGTIVSAPQGGANCFIKSGGTNVSGGYNLEDANTCNFNLAIDHPSTPTGLDPNLATNGASTMTHALLLGSAAIDQGSGFGETLDQPGLARVVDFSGIANAGDGADIGAFEFQLACAGQPVPGGTCPEPPVDPSPGSGWTPARPAPARPAPARPPRPPRPDCVPLHSGSARRSGVLHAGSARRPRTGFRSKMTSRRRTVARNFTRSVAPLAAVGIALDLAVAPAQASNGAFERAWGKNVNGSGVFGVCTLAASCLPGDQGVLGGELNNPEAIATDAAGNVYVSDNGRIEKFDSAIDFLLAWGKDVVTGGGTGFEICTVAASCKEGGGGGSAGAFNNPGGVAVDADGNVYVADSLNQRIQKFDSSGNFLLAWGKNVNIFGGNSCNGPTLCQAGQSGGLGGEFSQPWGLAAAGGSVYVTEYSNRRIQKFDSVGNFQRAWGKDVIQSGAAGDTGTGFEVCAPPTTPTTSCKAGATGELGGELFGPEGAAADSANNLYVADSSNNRIQKFDSSGNFLRAWGRDVLSGTPQVFEVCTAAAFCKGGLTGGLGGVLDFPAAVATDSANVLYVADRSNNRIQKFDSSGNFLRAWGKGYFNDTPPGFQVCTAAASCQSGLTGALGGELYFPSAVATDSANNLYVADSSNHRIQKFGDDNLAPTVTINQAAGRPIPPTRARSSSRSASARRRRASWERT